MSMIDVVEDAEKPIAASRIAAKHNLFNIIISKIIII
jgi:hypothetical protein